VRANTRVIKKLTMYKYLNYSKGRDKKSFLKINHLFMVI
jgi:hypothetical protein